MKSFICKDEGILVLYKLKHRRQYLLSKFVCNKEREGKVASNNNENREQCLDS
jgi:hypothetical protein